MPISRKLLFSCSCLLFTAACSSDRTNGSGDDGGDTPAACPVVVSDADCDKDQRPFVFVHGTYGSGDNFANVAALLGSNGFCQDRIFAIEYNSLGDSPADKCDVPAAGGSPPQGCGRLAAFIDKVLDDTGFTQVDLAGHSQGTRHCTIYLQDPAQAAKVAHYVNYSGGGAVENDVPTLSLSSERDLDNTPRHASGTDVQTVTFTDEDHFAVAASKRAFIETYKYLKAGEAPTYTEVQCGDEQVTIEGISETFADNVPLLGKLELREVTSAPRAAGEPVEILTPDANGHFGPLPVKRNVPYEFKGFDEAGTLIGYQYYSPFKRTNRLIRLLSPAFEADGSGVGGLVAAASTDHIVRGPNHVALVARWSGGAFRQDLGARLTIDGKDVLTDENAGAGALANGAGLGGGVVGFFMNDANTNGASDLGLYYSGPFIAFTDVFIDTETAKLSELDWTAGSEDGTIVNQKVKVSNWPSSDAQILVMFQ